MIHTAFVVSRRRLFGKCGGWWYLSWHRTKRVHDKGAGRPPELPWALVWRAIEVPRSRDGICTQVGATLSEALDGI
jgi:hypothetical protein